MLSGDALIYYSSHVKRRKTVEKATNLPRQWYNSADKRIKIISKCRSACFSEELSGSS